MNASAADRVATYRVASGVAARRGASHMASAGMTTVPVATAGMAGMAGMAAAMIVVVVMAGMLVVEGRTPSSASLTDMRHALVPDARGVRVRDMNGMVPVHEAPRAQAWRKKPALPERRTAAPTPIGEMAAGQRIIRRVLDPRRGIGWRESSGAARQRLRGHQGEPGDGKERERSDKA